MAVVLRTCSGQRVALIDDKDGAPPTPGRLGHSMERLRKMRSHFANLARSANAVAKFEQNRIFDARFCNKPICHALSCSCFSRANIPVENSQRILLGHEVAEQQFAAMMLPVPSREFAQVQQ